MAPFFQIMATTQEEHSPSPDSPAASRSPLVEIDRIDIHFYARKGLLGKTTIRAVSDLSLSIDRGETVAVVGLVIGLLLGFLLGLEVAIGYFIGAILSGLTGYIGMNVSVRANVRTAEAARTSILDADCGVTSVRE